MHLVTSYAALSPGTNLKSLMFNVEESSTLVSVWLLWHMPRQYVVAWGSSHRWAGFFSHLSVSNDSNSPVFMRCIPF